MRKSSEQTTRSLLVPEKKPSESKERPSLRKKKELAEKTEEDT